MFNKKNATRKSRGRRLLLESLETRKLMTVGCSLDASGMLNIRGDDTVDKVTIFQSGANTLVRAVNSSGVTKTFNMGSAVNGIDIRTFGGDDVVSNNTNLMAGIFGGDGNDILTGGSDSDVIYGELGNDTINGRDGSDFLFGGGGNDVIRGGASNDFIQGDDDTLDSLSVAAGNSLPYTNDDIINGGAGQDHLFGQLGRDRIYGGGSGDEIDGGRGNDVLYGDDSLNSAFVGADADFAGDDQITGGDGNDKLYGGFGEDRLHGGNGDDAIYGGANNDKLFGDGGADFLMGEAGDDFLDSGSATETNFVGGDGNDFIAYAPAVNGATFNDISQGDSNNCFILASMSAAVARGIDLASRITYTGDGWYSVALFQKNSMGGYSPTTINVYFDGSIRATDPIAHFRSQEGESWTVIMNRALATLLNVDLATTSGGYAGNVLASLTGRAPNTQVWKDNTGFVSPFFRDPILDLLFNVGNAVPTIVGTRNTSGELGSNLFAADHVYVVHSVLLTSFTFSPITNQMVPQYTIVLYNPWGTDNNANRIANGTAQSSGDNSDGLLVISGAEFKRNFDEITFA